MIIAGFFFSFVIGRMGSIVAKLDSRSTAHAEQLEGVTTFLKDTNLPRQLGKRCVCVCMLAMGRGVCPCDSAWGVGAREQRKGNPHDSKNHHSEPNWIGAQGH